MFTMESRLRLLIICGAIGLGLSASSAIEGFELEILRQEMISMKDEVMRLQHDNSRLLATVHGLETKTNALVETVQRQDEEMIALREDNEHMKADIANLEERDVKKAIILQQIQNGLNEELEGKEGDAITDGGAVTQPTDSGNRETHSTQQNTTSQRITKSRRFIASEPNETFQVAFSALVTPSDINNIQHGQKIVFDKVISNLGNAYDHSNGVFRVPVSGWYVFSLTIMSIPGQRQSLQVVANGASVFHCYSEGVQFNSGSKTIVWHAASGDSVWVEPGPWPGSSVHGDGHTSFTAFLLYTD